MVDYLACNFMDMSPIADGTFDRGYAIESTCHAPDKAGAFAEIYRVPKPVSLFWDREMCMTENFDPGKTRHIAIKADLMRGIALKDIAGVGEVNQALESAGFQVIEAKDRGLQEGGSTIPWHQPMADRHCTLGIAERGITVGRKAFLAASRLAESLRLFPKGSTEIAGLLIVRLTPTSRAAGHESSLHYIVFLRESRIRLPFRTR